MITADQTRATIQLPIRLMGGGNEREHWAKRHRRRRAERLLASSHTRYALRQLVADAKQRGAAITFTRIAPRPFDSDNLPVFFKALRDGVADAFGVDDSTRSKLTWRYQQESQGPKVYAIRVEIALAGGV